jgi:hypothetical protein
MSHASAHGRIRVCGAAHRRSQVRGMRTYEYGCVRGRAHTKLGARPAHRQIRVRGPHTDGGESEGYAPVAVAEPVEEPPFCEGYGSRCASLRRNAPLPIPPSYERQQRGYCNRAAG